MSKNFANNPTKLGGEVSSHPAQDFAVRQGSGKRGSADSTGSTASDQAQPLTRHHGESRSRKEHLFREGYYPGVISECLRLHMEYYAPRWGFGVAFETKLAREMGAFFESYDAGRDLFLTLIPSEAPADALGNASATIALDGSDAAGKGAHLRWFVAEEETRGRGLGNLLLGRVMAFCRERGHRRVYLTTFRGLDPARHLYEKHGFTLTAEKDEDQWKGGVVEQHFLWEDR